jgi:pyruvate decarboxylase
MTYTVGSYLAERLQQIGLSHHFAVAGDFNLVLLDQLLSIKKLQQVYCCNELNCGYSAEGYARARGAAAAVVTFSVGGLSAINAIGGAYAENLPVILVSGAPNSNDRATEHLIHHTLATHDWSYQFEIAKKLTCAAVSVTSATEAPQQIDRAIRSALRHKKPAYIEIACNIASAPCAAPGPISAILGEEPSDPATLRAAIAAAAEFLLAKQKPILLIGSKLRAAMQKSRRSNWPKHSAVPSPLWPPPRASFQRITPNLQASTGARSAPRAPARSSTGRTALSASALFLMTTRPSAGLRCRVVPVS